MNTDDTETNDQPSVETLILSALPYCTELVRIHDHINNHLCEGLLSSKSQHLLAVEESLLDICATKDCCNTAAYLFYLPVEINGAIHHYVRFLGCELHEPHRHRLHDARFEHPDRRMH